MTEIWLSKLKKNEKYTCSFHKLKAPVSQLVNADDT